MYNRRQNKLVRQVLVQNISALVSIAYVMRYSTFRVHRRRNAKTTANQTRASHLPEQTQDNISDRFSFAEPREDRNFSAKCIMIARLERPAQRIGPDKSRSAGS